MEVDLLSYWISDLLDESENHLEFFSFYDALSLVVPIATVLLLKRMIYLESIEVT